MAELNSMLQQAIALHRSGRVDDAAQLYREILKVDPNHADALQLLGAVAHQQGAHAEAVALLQRSLAVDPLGPRTWNNLGEALRAMGQLDEAEYALREAVRISPQYSLAHSNLLLTLQSDPRISPQRMLDEHLAWGRAHADPLTPAVAQYNNAPDPARRLNIGYVSPDLRRHSVAYFAEPLIRAHDRGQVSITCYYSFARSDEVTARIRASVDRWRDISSMNDDAVVDQIRADGIDILVDLCGHMAKNRLLVFARRPAPVQVTYLGYPNTTGMRAMDYRLTDALSDESGKTDAFHSERLVRLPTCLWCYQPPPDAPAVRPRDQDAPLTFGSFNKFPKHTSQVARLWARIIQSVPQSRLMLKSKSLVDPGTASAARRMFMDAGVPQDRVDLRSWDQTVGGHFDLYNSVDIGLDPFPYNGTTTTCEALWMGTPVVTLAGNTHVARVNVSLLSNAGLSELIAYDEEDYVRIAVELANDAERLRSLRTSLREQMRRSPLMDADRFARDVEAAYRSVWQTWCAQQQRAQSG